MNSFQQVKLFEFLIPSVFSNISYSKESKFERINGVKVEFVIHKLNIYYSDILDSDDYLNPIHSIHFVEKKIKPFQINAKSEFNESILNIRYVLILFGDIFNKKLTDIPLLTVNDFTRMCEIFDIKLLTKLSKTDIKQLDVNPTISGLNINKNLIHIDNEQLIFLDHSQKIAKSNLPQNIQNPINSKLEQKLYTIILRNVNRFGKELNLFRIENQTKQTSKVTRKRLNLLILKLQKKLDLINDDESIIESEMNKY